MSWWGKLAGGALGFVLGGPLGALIGAALGHNFDKGLGKFDEATAEFEPGQQERVQTAFFTASFAVMGALSKADGQVSRQEIQLAEAVMAQMKLNPDMRRAAIALFNQGKASDFDLDQVLHQFRQECHGRTTLMRMFMEIQIQAAYADGSKDPAEESMLLHMCSVLGISEFEFRGLERLILAHIGGAGASSGRVQTEPRFSLKDDYALLGVSESASDDEVKKAYRRLMSQHHPDKLVSKGLPDEMIALATQKTQEIKAAYERIRAARGG